MLFSNLVINKTQSSTHEALIRIAGLDYCMPIVDYTEAMRNPSFLSKQVDRATYYFQNLTATGEEPLAIVCGGVEHCRADYVMQRRTFRYHSIEFVAEGRGELRLGGKTVALTPGIAFSYRPGIPHRISSDPNAPITKYFIDFTGVEAGSLIDDTALGMGPVQVREPNRIRTVFDAIQYHADSATPQREAICLLQLRLLLQIIDSLRTRVDDVHSRAMYSYERCKRCIDDQFMSLTRLADVAKACHMDSCVICRLFKRFGDDSPYQYLLRRRMQHAADRLQTSDLLIKEVADAMGFSDPYHFSRSFKHVHGVSPQRFLALTHRTGAE